MSWTATNLAFRDAGYRRLTALLCLLLFLTLQIFAASGALHRALHADAAAADHHCAITLLAQGQLQSPGQPLGLLAFVATLIFSLPLLQKAAGSRLDWRLSPGRAPPRH